MLKVGDIIIFRTSEIQAKYMPIALVLETKEDKGLWGDNFPTLDRIKIVWLTGERKGEIYETEHTHSYRKIA